MTKLIQLSILQILAKSNALLYPIPYHDLIYDQEIRFEDIIPGFISTLTHQHLIFGETLHGMVKTTLPMGDLVAGTPTTPIQASAGLQEESLAVRNITTNVLCGVGLEGKMGTGSFSVSFSPPVKELGFTVTRIGAEVGLVSISFFDEEGVFVYEAHYDDNDFELGDSVAWRTNSTTIAGLTTISIGDGLCIDNFRYQLPPVQIALPNHFSKSSAETCGVQSSSMNDLVCSSEQTLFAVPNSTT